MEKIIIIAGPTGIGKTAFAVKAAIEFNGEIVGADSMQIYKYMTIGTAKPDPVEIQQVPHHLIDILDPKQPFDAGKFIALADQAIAKILKKGRVPIITGGTGLYIKALLHGLFRAEAICQKTLERLEKQSSQKGVQYLYDQLVQCDPEAAQKIHPNDTFRVIRALEVNRTTGQKISDQKKRHNFDSCRYDALKIGLSLDRDVLYQRINARVDLMLEQGLLDEVKSLLKKGYPFDLKSMQSIGYKHMGLFLNNETDWQETVRLLKRDTRRYAKRQLTWFRKDSDIIWFEPSQFERACLKIKEFLT